MKPNIENALAACGRERVLHRENGECSSVAIRVSGIVLNPEPDEQRVILANGKDLDEAGEAAARQFAERLGRAAENMNAWAERITRALAERKPDGGR